MRKNKQICAGKLDEVQLSSISTSSSSSPVKSSTCPDQVDLEAIKSSLLKESADSFAQPYDLSVLLTTDFTSYPAKVPAVDDASNDVHR